MGSPTTDYSVNYAPTIDQSRKLDIKTGIQSPEVAAIMGQASRLFETRLDNQRRELESLREENRNIRRDMKDFTTDERRNSITKGRDGNDYTLRNKELDLRGRDNEMRHSYNMLKTS